MEKNVIVLMFFKVKMDLPDEKIFFIRVVWWETLFYSNKTKFSCLRAMDQFSMSFHSMEIFKIFTFEKHLLKIGYWHKNFMKIIIRLIFIFHKKILKLLQNLRITKIQSFFLHVQNFLVHFRNSRGNFGILQLN